MEVLLAIFAGAIAVSVVVQGVFIVKMYYSWSRFSKQLDKSLSEAREVMVPVKSITENLRLASANLVEIGTAARDQFRRVEVIVTETGEALHTQIERLDQVGRDVVDRSNETAQVVQDSVIRPFREVSAIAKGIARGLEAFLFRRNRSTVDQAHQDEELFI